MSITARRRALLAWLRHADQDACLTAAEIMHASSLYTTGAPSRDRALCRADLRHLHAHGDVARYPGTDTEQRPHRWSAR